MIDVSNYLNRKSAGLVQVGKVGGSGVINIKTFDPQLGTAILTANVIRLADVQTLITQTQSTLNDLNQLLADLQGTGVLV